ncbi:MAG: hypothetical protein Q7J98_10005 [Kiritimatiellia bacterium]|nr:hypothetical protein [Kiritimatiellia bacterium]
MREAIRIPASDEQRPCFMIVIPMKMGIQYDFFLILDSRLPWPTLGQARE